MQREKQTRQPRDTKGVRVTPTKCARVMCAAWTCPDPAGATLGKIERLTYLPDALRVVSYLVLAGLLRRNGTRLLPTLAGLDWLMAPYQLLPAPMRRNRFGTALPAESWWSA